MKILNINKFFYPRRGAEHYFFALTDLLKTNGHDVIPFSMHHPENLDSPYSEYFVSELDLSQPGLKQIGQAKRFIWNKQAHRQLDRLLKEHKPDIAHIHNIYHQISPSILKTLKKYRIRIVMTVHDFKLICPNYSLYTEGNPCTRCLGHKYYNAVIHKCLKDSRAMSALAATEMTIHKLKHVYEKHVDYFIAPSNFVKDICVKFGQDPKQFKVVPHFISDSFSIPKTAKKPKDYVLFAGALREDKGVDILLDLMHNKMIQSSLKLAGRGPLQSRLKEKIKQYKLQDRVELLGQCSQKELHKVMASAKATLIPSRLYETFGLSALESIALGTPVVAYAMGGLTETITKDVGITVELDDTEAFAAAVNEVCTWKKSSVLKAGKKLVAEKYSSKKHYDALMKIYQSLL